ncbi:hypothetical protein BMA721280_E0487 [Burkholderia mallei 2002721280]|nr:hypothetical protein BMA721280_E0487 [Burkholderia mallei 2002721280]EDP85834.1 hypothetical protein BMA10399_D0534 [Burkholderia mallei ATCC 10399]
MESGAPPAPRERGRMRAASSDKQKAPPKRGLRLLTNPTFL